MENEVAATVLGVAGAVSLSFLTSYHDLIADERRYVGVYS